MDDLINRQDGIMHFVKASKNYECRMFSLAEVTHELWEIPSAQRKGKWIHQGVSKSYRFTCSVCGQTAYYVSGSCASTKNKVMNVCKYNFCPWCGADMRGEEE